MLGLGLHRQSGVQPLYRRDASAYRHLIFSDTGVWLTDEAMADIRAFAKGLYARFGRTDFFTFRSTQNVGTGSMAYSFHGKTATLNNGSVWSVDGIAFPTNFGGVVLSLPSSFVLPLNNGGWSIISAIKGSGNNYYGRYGATWPSHPLIMTNSNWVSHMAYAGYPSTAGIWANLALTGINRDTWNTYYMSMLDNSIGGGAGGINGQILATTNDPKTEDQNFDSSNPVFYIGNSLVERGVAFFVRLPVASQTNENFAFVHNLTKSTIGKGLGLP